MTPDPAAASPSIARPGHSGNPGEVKGKAARLPLPASVEVGRINWIYAITIGSVHLLALAAVVPYLFSWTGLIVMILGVHVFGQGINLCYHRQLTHRSFRTPKWLEHLFVWVALCCLQDTPGRWVATHRKHHLESDHQPDPHSPLVSFLWSHIGWLMVHDRESRTIGSYERYARDVLQDRFYLWLEKTPIVILMAYFVQAAVFFGVGFGVGYYTAAEHAAATGVQFGLSLFVWGVLVRTVAVWHITWSVNSLTHLFGYRRYDTPEYSTNNWLVALLTVGEGWHNNHHDDQASASNQRSWWEFDVTYYEIKLLEVLGLAKDVVKSKSSRQAAAAARAEARAKATQR